MVGVGLNANVSVLARVSIVNGHGHVVYDQHVRVEEKVTDYRTAVSGIRKEDLELKGISYGKCRAQVRKLLYGKVLIGHGIHNDLAVLNLRHAPHLLRDTSLYLPYMKDFGNGVVRSRSLRDLAREFCGLEIQEGEHCSIEDAKAAMALYAIAQVEWDEYYRHSFPHHAPPPPPLGSSVPTTYGPPSRRSRRTKQRRQQQQQYYSNNSTGHAHHALNRQQHQQYAMA